ncbi:hypothetical protein G7046_g8751 [Stylonectria norvegica]|nr:hypothetical protein G7046_g8751 [Stylonectria norvegica]
MGAKSGLTLKFLQWFIRGVQFGCAALILAVFSYFLATLHNHHLPISTKLRAVEGISGVAVLYTLAGLLLLCCVAGLAFTSAIAILFDVAFIGAFIYVAIANKNGASSCNGYVDTPFGRGNVFFILSILVELALARHHRKEKRFGPSPKNNYTSGSGKKGGFLSRILRRRGNRGTQDAALPAHTTPSQLEDYRQSNGTERTAVNSEPTVPYNKYESSQGHELNGVHHNGAHHNGGHHNGGHQNLGHQTGVNHVEPMTQQPPANYRLRATNHQLTTFEPHISPVSNHRHSQMSEAAGEDDRERLKAALWYAVGQIVDEESMRRNRNATPQFIGALTEMVWNQMENVATDLESFCNHAGRSTVTTDDVLLLARKNPDLHQIMKEFIDQAKAEKEAGKARGTVKGKGRQ